MAEEMKDRFGPPPREVENLLKVMSVRLLLKRTRILRLDVASEGLTITFSPDTLVRPEKLVSLAKRDPRRYRFLSERKLKIRLTPRPPLEALDDAKRVLADFQSESQ
jgi:transcription-repair coupling factor (superfamily II helicase)